MERTLDERKYSYAGLFKHVGRGNKLHVSLQAYTKAGVQVECTRQNKYAGSGPTNNRYITLTTDKAGYITIVQRY